MEIHYVNKALNTVADTICIKMTDDDYTFLCAENIFTKVLAIFLPKFTASYQAASIIGRIMFERNVDAFLKSDFKYEKIQAFEQTLDRYGEDKDFSFQELIEVSDDGTPPKPFWYAQYSIYLTLLNRLLKSGYLSTAGKIETTVLPNGDIVHLCKNNSLKLAWVEGNGERQSFIPYCINLFAAKDKKIIDALMTFLLSRATELQRFDMVDGILDYIKQHEQNWMPSWLEWIVAVEPECKYFDVVIKTLPSVAIDAYLRIIGHDKLIQSIRNGDQLCNVLSVMGAEKGYHYLLVPLRSSLPTLITRVQHLTQVLAVTPAEEVITFLKSTGKLWLSAIQQEIIQPDLLALLFKMLPATEWDALFNYFCNKPWMHCVRTMEQLIAILKTLDADKWAAFFEKYNSRYLLELMGCQRTMLFFVTVKWERLQKLLTSLTIEQSRIVLKHFGSDKLYELLVGRVDNPLYELLAVLPEDKCTVLLDSFNQSSLDGMFTTMLSGYNLGGFFTKLCSAKTQFLLSYLGVDRVVRLIKSEMSFWSRAFSHFSHEKYDCLVNFLGHDKVEVLLSMMTNAITSYNNNPGNQYHVFNLLVPYGELPAFYNAIIRSYLNCVFDKRITFMPAVGPAENAAVIDRQVTSLRGRFRDNLIKLEHEEKVLKKVKLPINLLNLCVSLRFSLINDKGANDIVSSMSKEAVIDFVFTHLGPILKTLNNEDCLRVLQLLGADRRHQVLDRLQELIQHGQSFQLLCKLPDTFAIPVVTRFSFDLIARYLQSPEQMIAVFSILPGHIHTTILDQIDAKHLASLLLEGQSVKSAIAQLESCRKNAYYAYETMLLAILRARKYQLSSAPPSTKASLLSFWKPAPDNKEGYALLDTAISKNLTEGNHAGLTFFRTHLASHREQEEAFNHGDLQQLTHAFQL